MDQLPGYTEDQAMRLLTQGAIDREGRQLQLPMPRYRMNPQDAADVIAFLRSLLLEAAFDVRRSLSSRED